MDITVKDLLEIFNQWLKLLAPFGVVGGLLWKLWLKNKFKKASDLYQKIHVIAGEFRPNGGSTLRDAINRIETKLSLQQQTTTAIIKSFPIGTWISDEHGRWVEVNKNLCRIMSRTEAEIKGDNWVNWILERDEVTEYWNKCVVNDINFDLEYTFIFPDRRKQRVHGFAQRLKNERGELIGFLGTLEAIGDPFM